MKMKCIKFVALASILTPMIFSCSGAGSSDTLLFGSLPGVYGQFQAEEAQLQEEAKNITSEAEKAKLIEKSEKMKEEWSGKIEESAKALDGKTIEFAESDIKVTEPISLQFDGFFSEIDMTPQFKINGSAEAPAEINTGEMYLGTSENVYIVGYNAEGQEVYKINAGFIPVENVDGKAVVKAGTAVNFDTLYFSEKKAEEYEAAKSLKLEVRRK